ncbi:MBL fold metallo-hydrolase [Vibrio splendidus]|uniref:MBL fold metallo-hydrolase n=1 Tax=Vibrio splendidus TaxID=29497 RepID=UPI0015E6DFB3|nr:MBL fold metallo-hydrolase [Vibrio splendidus]
MKYTLVAMMCFLSIVGCSASESVENTSTKVIEGSTSFMLEKNNNHIIDVQNGVSDYKKNGDVAIEFYGHMAFKIVSPEGLSILIDPWRNDPTGVFGKWYKHDFPNVDVDIALSSHAHFDHDALYRAHATMNLERLSGVFELGDVKITGLADKHQCHAPGETNWTKGLKDNFGLDLNALCPKNAPMSWDNNIFVIETGGLKIGFWGDNRPDLPDEIRSQLKDLDIMIMNIDGSRHILSYKQVEEILKDLKPKTVIPGHYFTRGLELTESTLKSADLWVAVQENSETLSSNTMIFNQKLVDESPVGMVYYFRDNYKQK